ncbi:cytochrome P450 [Nocardia sp. NBC_00881]|uniref:cytochrome P450 n=1 Tax=Nocardia sp. NBC_00881 TaxID=2975995 RepID=UPI003864551B|nr:cytochrome P450 [Nocardia sp. NBC_00881]
MTRSTVPDPTTHTPPSAGVRPGLIRDPFRFVMDAAARHDGLVRIGAGPLETYIVSHPEYVRRILVTNAANYVKGSLMKPFRTALGNGLVTSEGEHWKRQRRLMQPAFHAAQLRTMEGHITACVERAVQRWESAADAGRAVNFLDDCIELNVEIVLGVLFSTSIDTARAERLRELTSQVFVGLSSKVWTFFLPGWFPMPGAVRYRRAVAALDAEVYALIEERRAADAETDDLLGLLLDAVDAETGAGMSDRQLRDEIFTLFMSGYETTATGLTWSAYELARNPEVVAAMAAELDRETTGVIPTFAELPRLEYGKRVIDEAFRLHPAFPIWFRSTVEPDLLGPYQLPANAKIVINPHITHRDPRFWDDPETFDPQRFTTERFDARTRHAYYPFGKGSRVCIGERLAVTITQMVLSAFTRRFQFAVQPDFEVVPHYVVTCQPKGGLPLILRNR